MNWYTGDIGAAISESRTKKLIFMVHTFEPATPQDDLWSQKEIYQLCNENCVCLKLQSDQPAFAQFIQIYPVTQQPTTYLIGMNGQPLEVIAGAVSHDEFIVRMSHAIEKHSPPSASSGAESAATTSSNAAADAASVDASGENSDKNAKSLEEKVAEAREKIKVIQEKKKAEQEEKSKSSELERRKMGQEMLKMKRDKEEEELKKIAEERRREKLADEMAKKKVLEQIRIDREEKQKRFSKEKEEAEKAEAERKAKLELQRQQEKQVEAAARSNVARLQFRFVDGSSSVNQFTPDQTLDEVRQHVAQKLREMNETAPFAMHTSYPKREFAEADMGKTLRDLQLAPSASLLIIPMRSGSSKTAVQKLGQLFPSASSSASSTSTRSGTSSSSSTNSAAAASSSTSLVTYIGDFASILFLPLTIVWGIVRSLFGATNAATPASATTAGSSSNRAQTGASSAQSASSLRQRGSNNNSGNRNNNRRTNFRDLNDDRTDGDDENATWNGNSTQQM